MKIIFWLFILIASLSFTLCGQKQLPGVVPEPQEYSIGNGKFRFSGQTVQIKQYCRNYEQIGIALQELSSLVKELKGVSFSEKINSTQKILLGIPGEDKNFRNFCKSRNLLPEEKLGEEGYCLKISPEEIIISANSQKGIFYALQTLKQIVRSSVNKDYLPEILIKDWPSLKYRAVMDDISRGPLPTMDFIKYQIRRLAAMKVNTFMHYVEHVVKTKSHPEFAPEDGSISIEEWKELSDYASKYNITLAGSFQSFGHFNNILSTPKYAHLGECGTLISPLLPESYKFLNDIYSEMVPAFKAPFFNINCDETFDLGKGQSRRLADSIGYAGVYYNHVMKLYESVKKLNSNIMIWGDVLLEYPELLKKLPKDIIIGTWTYDDLDSYSKFIEPVKEAGFRFFVTPGVLNSNRIFPNFKQAFGNIKGFANAAVEYGAMGLINTVWDDGGTALFSNDWYGVAYGADKAWNVNSSDSSAFDSRLNAGIYGTENNVFTEAIQKLGCLSELEPTDGLNDKILFEKLVPDSGKSLRVMINEWDKALSISSQTEDLLKNCKLNNCREDRDYVLFTAGLYTTLALERTSLIKASEYYRDADNMASGTPEKARALLLKALELLDGIIERESSIRNKFEALWLRENKTYSLSRIVENHDRKIKDYEDIKNRVTASLKRLDSSLPVFHTDQVRLNIIPIKDKYFREWLVVNPIPADIKNMGTDYLASIGGEKYVVPKVTQEFYYDSVKYRWTRLASSYQDVVNLKEIFPTESSNSLTYAFATIESSRDTVVKAYTGFAGAIMVILNGETVFQGDSAEKLVPDENSFVLRLHKGINNLMLKIPAGGSQWGFSLRLSDFKVSSRKNRYKIISGQTSTLAPLDAARRIADRVISETSFELTETDYKPSLNLQVVDLYNAAKHKNESTGKGRTVYAFSKVNVNEAAILKFGISYSEPLKVWINDRMVFENKRPVQFSFRETAYSVFAFQDTFQAVLNKGDNRIVIESALEGKPAVYLREIMGAEDKGKAEFHNAIASNKSGLPWSYFVCKGECKFVKDDLISGSAFTDSMYFQRSPVKDLLSEMPSVKVKKLLINPKSTFRKDSFADWNYPNGALMMTLFNLYKASGDDRYKDYVSHYCSFIKENIPRARNQYFEEHDKRGIYYRIFRKGMLDDAGAPVLPFIELASSGVNEYDSLVNEMVNYVSAGQIRLSDGTLCRPEPEEWTIWADDLFMSVPLLLRAGHLYHDTKYFDDAAMQVTSFSNYLFDTETRLFKHGWFSRTKSKSNVFWGRANGWVVWATSEALELLPKDHPSYKLIENKFREHLEGILKVQDKSGMWHQILDDETSFEETSCTAMFIVGLTRAVLNGSIDRKECDNIYKAWNALQKKIEDNGIVKDICCGTGIGQTKEFYNTRDRLDNDPRGLGSVILAAIEIDRLNKFLKK